MSEDKEYTPTPKAMERSRVQLATSYSPGTLFTLEGDLVACESKPLSAYNDSASVNNYTKQQIFQKIEEKTSAWYSSAFDSRPGLNPKMCIDEALLDTKSIGLRKPFPEGLFAFVEAQKLAYEPVNLTFVCNQCKMVKVFPNLKSLTDRRNELRRENCPDPKEKKMQCLWKQMDIVFVHPNGNYMQPVPWKWDWSDNTNQEYKSDLECSSCSESEVKINDGFSQIGKRYFYCAKCETPRNLHWLQNDRECINLVGSDDSVPFALKRMKPVSYRSNSVHYTQQDVVIDFEKNEKLEILSDETGERLKQFVASRFNIEASHQSDDEIHNAVVKKRGIKEWESYQIQIDTLHNFRLLKIDQAWAIQNMKVLQDDLAKTLREWREAGVIESLVKLPGDLDDQLVNRSKYYASKYDPYRFLVEHSALRESVICEKLLQNGLRRFVPLDDMDEYIGPSEPNDRALLNSQHREIMDGVGIEEIGLVRDFKLSHFSFGYTRVGATPYIEYINKQTSPVRLRLFDKTTVEGQRKHPIYVINQRSEAIYVKLNQETVRNWLVSIKPNEQITKEDIGLQFLKHLPEMTPFLDHLPGNDVLPAPNISLAIYSLLHSYAHHIMGAITEFSGLSIGSLGEYIFPADLAFIIYRSGSTVDLGNMTSMLRDNTPAFLDYISDMKSLECGSGSLCLSRGGACPDCILIPEVTCVAQNKLLSRTLLIGKDSPNNYGFHSKIEGFFNISMSK